MKRTYTLERTCKHCGKKISDQNKSEYCKDCYPKYGMLGENNPFYGKKHSTETKNILKEKCKIASKNKWKDEKYRERVLNAVVGLKRTDKFKQEQSLRTKQQMQDPNQLKIRSIAMKKSWENGNIVHTQHISTNSSKQEREFFELLNKKIYVKQKQVIKYVNKQTHRKKHLFPDGIIEDIKLVLEFNGSFWHADKRFYKEDQIVHHGICAGKIWAGDKNKIKIYNSLGYNVLTIWSYDFLQDKELCVNNTINIINSYQRKENKL